MNQKKSKNLKVGHQGEIIVKQWLVSQGWEIIACRWRCIWGEIDLIAQQKASRLLAFIEVKTRSKFNLDQQGLESITMAKQEKIIQTAETFLIENPQFEDYYLRFDVALVHHRDNYFQLINYIESAFEIN